MKIYLNSVGSRQMATGRALPFAIYLLLTLFSLPSSAQKAVPELWGQRVHDDAHALKQETVDQLEKGLKTYEDSTSNQIAILIVQSLDNDVLEEYSLRVAEKWKLGKKGKDNGVLLLVAVDDHKMRIEVGQGLEGVLTDAQSNRIIRNEMAPEFRRGDYDAGIKAGINGIIKSIAGEYKADDASASDDLSSSERILYGLFIFGILGIFTLVAVFTQGCTGWGLYAFLLPFYALFPLIVISFNAATSLIVIYMFGVPVLKALIARTKWGKEQLKKWKASSSSGSGSGWSSGWGGGGSSWSNGGSSFSGGGGSFGGGGSSGGW
ncbi:MAG TPA: TPM domain-containing protein [Cyclobacteriaceae bacterium]|nr:TPM domain-containing protein [Cyclobacteriaceae bacterium]